MTGYNHHPDCSCGWCVNHGRTRVSRADIQASLRVREAENFLKKNGARSISGCYVNPNARCPECGVAVFFYANEFGSKVYFDDLGPPWPKHPCTDNPRHRIKKHRPLLAPPSRRARGITQELIEAARVVGSLRGTLVGGERWHLMVIVSVNRHGTKNSVVAQLLASDDREQASFTCHSEAPLFEVDDFISKRGDEYSFLDKNALTALTFRNGGWVGRAEAPLKALASPPKPTLRPKATPLVVAAASTARTYDMTRQEMGHFHSKKKSVQQLCDELMPMVRAYSREGDRKPRDVAVRLNRDGYRTLLGSRWNPRLTHFLLRLIFMPSQSDGGVNKKPKRPEGPRNAPGSPERTGPMTPDEMARLLSKIGRVVLTNNGSE